MMKPSCMISESISRPMQQRTTGDAEKNRSETAVGLEAATNRFEPEGILK